MSRLRTSLLSAAVLLLGTHLALASNVAVGTCKPSLPSYPSISAAVAGAPTGSTVEICPAAYYEQVFINQSLNLEGVSSGNSTDVVIYPPATGLTTVTEPEGYVLAPGIVVNAGPVNISNVTVDATGNLVSPGSANCVGIYYNDGVSGTINEVTARLQNGCGGYDSGVWADTTASSTLTVENSSFHNIGDSSVLIIGGINLTLKGNTMEASAYNAQAFVTNLTMTGNFLEGTGCCWGLTTFYTAGTVSSNTIDNTGYGVYEQGGSTLDFTRNSISNSQVGIYLNGGGDTFKSNTISRSSTAIEFNCNGPTVNSNTVNDATTGFDLVPAGFSGVNKFNNVSTIRTDGCTEGATKHGPGSPGKPMPAPSR
ncbi:MAG: right-handed parallel beta-helix repeat-containing protein [Terriglobales bacterium]